MALRARSCEIDWVITSILPEQARFLADLCHFFCNDGAGVKFEDRCQSNPRKARNSGKDWGKVFSA
jgi:hypothetical protein